MLNLVRLCVLLLLLLLSTFISPMFFNTNHISNSTTSESVMEGWFKFTLDEIHQGVLGRKRKPVSRLSKWFDNNANKKNFLTPIDDIDHCCKRKCFKLNTICCSYSTFTITIGRSQRTLRGNNGKK